MRILNRKTLGQSFLALIAVLGLGTHNSFAEKFKLTSQTLKKGTLIGMDQVFNGFGCIGKNISPDLQWNNPPAGTQSFAVTVYDPDAPTGSGWWHWVVFNIPADVRKLDLNAGDVKARLLPASVVQSQTDFGQTGYGGPCPPEGSKAHRYIFKVYALKTQLPLDEKTPAAQVGFYINQNKLAVAELTATFKR